MKETDKKPLYGHVGFYYFDIWFKGFYHLSTPLIENKNFKQSICTHLPFNAPNVLNIYVKTIEFMLLHNDIYTEEKIQEYMQLIKAFLEQEGY